METGNVKRNVLILLVCTLVGLIISMKYDERQETAIQEYDVDDTQYENTSAENMNPYLDIGIMISGAWHQRIVLYSDESMLYAFLPTAADKSDLKWSFNENDYKIIYADAEISDGEPVIIYDKGESFRINTLTEDTEKEYQLYVLQSENIPSIFINTQSGTMDWIHANKGNRESGELISVNENGKLIYTGGLEKITGRGNSSWEEDKKSYSITLSEKASLADMPAAAKWVLQANALDATRMRNKLTYDLARDMGLQSAINSAYADVWLNGEYAGNYLVCEKIEAGETRVDISMDEPVGKAERYIRGDEGAWWKYHDKQNMRNGYLLEFNERIGSEEDCYFYAENRQVEIKTPAQPSYEEYAYIREYAQKLTESTKNAENSNIYLEYIDLESWSQLFLINELSNDTDANRHSVFYYKDKETKMFAGPIWDYDIAWGNDFLGKDSHCSFFRIGWYGTLYDNHTFYQSIIEHYKNMRLILEQYLNNHIDILCDTVRRSVQMDDVRWAHNEGYTKRSDERQWKPAVENLRNYIRKRMEYYDKIWLSGDAYHRVFFYSGDTVVAVTYVKDGETVPKATLNYVANCMAIDSWHTQDEKPFDGSAQVFSNLRLY